MKNKIEKIKLGSQIAKNGFKNEKEIAEKFNNWEFDTDAQKWLDIMGYNISDIEYVRAIVISGHKADINVSIQIKLKDAIDVENIQVKLVSNRKGFNQIDKRWIDSYKQLWNIPDDICEILRYFTGENKPYKSGTVDKRRMFIYELSKYEQNKLFEWINKNKVIIVTDVLRGRGEFCAEWILVAQKTTLDAKWILKNINEVIGYYFNDGEVVFTPRGSIRIGHITIQRKGGDNGRNTANMLQFKIDPSEIFNI